MSLKNFSPQLFWRLIDLVVGGIFIYAGMIKALKPVRFATDIDNYKILPWVIGIRLAFYLPWLEILCGAALITRRLYRGGLSILIALVSVFIVASIIAKVRGIDVSCGCFGHVSRNFSFSWHLALDFAILSSLALSFARAGWGLSRQRNLTHAELRDLNFSDSDIR